MTPTRLGEHNNVYAELRQLAFSPANVDAAQLFKENLKEYERRVKVRLLICFHKWVVIETNNGSRKLSSFPGWITQMRSKPKWLKQMKGAHHKGSVI